VRGNNNIESGFPNQGFSIDFVVCVAIISVKGAIEKEFLILDLKRLHHFLC